MIKFKIKEKKKINTNLINQIYNCLIYNSKERCGCQKTRGEKNFSKIKISPQKGTGKARLGNRSSPILKGGGRAFPSKRTKKKKKINKKMYRKCIKQCLYYKQKKSRIFILRDYYLIKKTKDFVNKLIKKKIYKKKILMVLNGIEVEKRFFKNVKNVIIDTIQKLSLVNIINSDYIIFYNNIPKI
ncbi:50S ribosomal protein L4 [Candidatus Vidania fulgoroideorum]